MSIWKEAVAKESRNCLYVEEINTNDDEDSSRRLEGISTGETVQNLKRALAANLNNPAGWGQINVAFGNQELTDLNATISSYGIEDGDTLFFTRAVIPQVPRTDPPPAYAAQADLEQIQFKDVDGKTLILRNIPLSSKVRDLLQRLASEKHIEIEYYGFNYGGKPLKNDLSLFDYGLHKGSTIHMHMRLRGGSAHNEI